MLFRKKVCTESDYEEGKGGERNCFVLELNQSFSNFHVSRLTLVSFDGKLNFRLINNGHNICLSLK